MNNVTNKLFTSVANFAETPGVIANTADKLLSRILSEENVAALRCFNDCTYCLLGWKRCRVCCDRAGKDICEGWRLVRC